MYTGSFVTLSRHDNAVVGWNEKRKGIGEMTWMRRSGGKGNFSKKIAIKELVIGGEGKRVRVIRTFHDSVKHPILKSQNQIKGKL